MTTNNVNQKSFEELVAEAAKIADARTKVFNELIQKIKSDYLPAMAKVMKGYEISSIFLDLPTRPIKDLKSRYDYNENREMFGLEFSREDNKITSYISVEYNYSADCWKETSQRHLIEEGIFLKTGSLDLVYSLKNKIAALNDKYSSLNQKASIL